MIIIRNLLGLIAVIIFGLQGPERRFFTRWCYETEFFIHYGEATAFAKIFNWALVFLFIASCFLYS